MEQCCKEPPKEDKPCCCGPKVQATNARWIALDRWGALLCRISNRFRSHYKVKPGVYAMGKPTAEAPALVTANYKLTFDHVRKDLEGIDAWILVLDTKGINVWCSAGKGTFGTCELVDRIESEKLAQKVSHRRLIVPQLGAPGIAAHEVKKKTGFSITFGPIRSKDLKAFIDNNYTATDSMRTVTFTTTERSILIPIEIVSIAKKAIFPLLAVALVMGLQKQGIMFGKMASLTMPLFTSLCLAIFSGCILHPLFLPILVIRPFALQGVVLGLATSVVAHFTGLFSSVSILGQAAVYLLITALSSYCAFNFTGSTPIANKSGVKKELKISLPLYIGSGIALFILLVLYKISAEGLL